MLEGYSVHTFAVCAGLMKTRPFDDVNTDDAKPGSLVLEHVTEDAEKTLMTHRAAGRIVGKGKIPLDVAMFSYRNPCQVR